MLSSAYKYTRSRHTLSNNSLRNKSSVGWDEISTKLLTSEAIKLVSLLTLIIRVSKKSLQKNSNNPRFLQFFKKYVKTEINHYYRPISVLSSIYKVFEKDKNVRLV